MAHDATVDHNGHTSPTSPLLRLPIELIDNICKHVAYGSDRKALSRFSKTCRKIRGSAVQELFKNVSYPYVGLPDIITSGTATFISEDDAVRGAVRAARFQPTSSGLVLPPPISPSRPNVASVASILQRLSSFSNVNRLAFHLADLHLVNAEQVIGSLRPDLFPHVESLETCLHGAYINRLCPCLTHHSIVNCEGSTVNCNGVHRSCAGSLFNGVYCIEPLGLIRGISGAKGITHLEMKDEHRMHQLNMLEEITLALPNLTKLALHTPFEFNIPRMKSIFPRIERLRVLHLPVMDWDNLNNPDDLLSTQYWHLMNRMPSTLSIIELTEMAIELFRAVPSLQNINAKLPRESGFSQKYYLMTVVHNGSGEISGISSSFLKGRDEPPVESRYRTLARIAEWVRDPDIDLNEFLYAAAHGLEASSEGLVMYG